MVLVLVATAALGLAVGSFLNVVVHRVPRRLSLVAPGSHCPACEHPVRARHNVPVLGWLVLRGRCADCATPISVRYPVVEALTAVLLVVVTHRLLVLDLAGAVPAFWVFTALGIALALVDLEQRRLPDALTLPAYPVLAALLALAAVVAGDPAGLLRAAAGAGASVAFYLLLASLGPGLVGLGDVKAAGLVGGVLGFLSFPVLVVGTLLAFALGAVVGVGVLVARRGRVRTVPFGPFMVAGAVAAVLGGAPLAQAYLDLLPA